MNNKVMDVFTQFLKKVRVKQNLYFFIKAQSREFDDLPFIYKNNVVNNTLASYPTQLLNLRFILQRMFNTICILKRLIPSCQMKDNSTIITYRSFLLSRLKQKESDQCSTKNKSTDAPDNSNKRRKTNDASLFVDLSEEASMESFDAESSDTHSMDTTSSDINNTTDLALSLEAVTNDNPQMMSVDEAVRKTRAQKIEDFKSEVTRLIDNYRERKALRTRTYELHQKIMELGRDTFRLNVAFIEKFIKDLTY